MSHAPKSFFRSRWVERPAHVRQLKPVLLPKGFVAAGVAAGIKPSGLDMGMVLCEERESASAARFTRNAAVAAPVVLCLEEGSLDVLRAVVVNSGNANAATGEKGMAAARAMRDSAARALGLHPHLIGVASTGKIGQPLAAETLIGGVEKLVPALSAEGGDDFSRAILTTDNGPKRGALEVELSGGSVLLSAQAKGAGMIAPALSSATTLCFVETDAAISAGISGELLDAAIGESLEKISVDGDMSTNDSIFLLASGASGVAVSEDLDKELFGTALTQLLLQLALEIVADGEGATRSTRLMVRGARNGHEAELVARAVARSPLVKTAFFGGQADSGRVIAAAGAAIGRAVHHREQIRPSVRLEQLELCRDGSDVELSGEDRQQVRETMQRDEVEWKLDLHRGHAETEIFFSDLTHDYVSLNAE